MIGSTISHYEILSELGRGGMGVVYRARDTELGRDVALKVLAGHLRGDPKSQARFVQEAKAASALNHDHIGVVHEIGKADDGRLFMSMAYYEGQTLDALVAEGPLPEADATHFASQAASALAAAHEAGIVHRDIKPGNLLVPERGSLKVLDFGLAKLADSADITTTGSTIGTQAYMSPEQTRGEPAGPASDVWSLGAVLYEMLAGRRPFNGRYPTAVAYSILNEEPAALDGVSPALAEVVAACMAKEPADRPSAADVFETLRPITVSAGSLPVGPLRDRSPSRWIAASLVLIATAAIAFVLYPRTEVSAAGNLDNRVSVAVVPFENLSPDPGNAFLGIGLAEDLSYELGAQPQVRVPGRAATRSFGDSPPDAKGLGRILNVDFVLQGSVRREGDRHIVNVELTDTRTGISTWRHRFDESSGNTLAVQDDIRAGILSAIDVQRIDGELALAPLNRTTDPRAYELYLRGIERSKSFDPPGAIEYFEQALALDSVLASAHTGIAWELANLYSFGWASMEMIGNRARHHAARAIDLAPNRPGPHVALSRVVFDTEQRFKIASTALSLGDPAAFVGGLYRFGGISESIDIWGDWVQLEPDRLDVAQIAAFNMMHLGRVDLAETVLDSIAVRYPREPIVGLRRAELLLKKGQAVEALAMVDALLGLVGESNTFFRFYRGAMAYFAGEVEWSRSDMAYLDSIAIDGYTPAAGRAFLHALHGENERAFELLNLAIAQEGPWAWVAVHSPWPESVRSDPRFEAYLNALQPSNPWVHARYDERWNLLNAEEVEAHALPYPD